MNILNKETIKTIINTICTILTALGALITIESCTSKLFF